MKKSLLALAFGGLGLGMTEFAMMGVLPDVARSLSISIPRAGHCISAYALGVGVGAPLLIMLARNFPPKRILLLFMMLFTVANTLSAFSPNYWTMMAMRFMAGLPHGAYFGVGAVVAGRLADEGKGAQAVSVMFAGLTVANLIGVPLGTYIGNVFSWRYTFVMVGLWGLVTLWFLYRWVPVMKAAVRTPVREQFSFLKLRSSWVLFFVTMLGNGGFFAWFSYIQPQMTDMAHIHEEGRTFVMVVAGLGMFVGNLVGGRMSDKYTPARTALYLLSALMLSLLAMHFVAGQRYLAILMTFFCTAGALALSTPMQVLMIRNATPGRDLLAASASQVAFNLGNAIGAYCGGLPLEYGLNYSYPVLVGAGFVLSGFLAMRLFRPLSAKESFAA